VTDDASVAAAVETVGAVDVLVNNAGISGGRLSPSEGL
jgi:NADP-dependent 3-hydroxy acid dehydrogenase YdfG